MLSDRRSVSPSPAPRRYRSHCFKRRKGGGEGWPELRGWRGRGDRPVFTVKSRVQLHINTDSPVQYYHYLLLYGWNCSHPPRLHCRKQKRRLRPFFFSGRRSDRLPCDLTICPDATASYDVTVDPCWTGRDLSAGDRMMLRDWMMEAWLHPHELLIGWISGRRMRIVVFFETEHWIETSPVMIYSNPIWKWRWSDCFKWIENEVIWESWSKGQQQHQQQQQQQQQETRQKERTTAMLLQ